MSVGSSSHSTWSGSTGTGVSPAAGGAACGGASRGSTGASSAGFARLAAGRFAGRAVAAAGSDSRGRRSGWGGNPVSMSTIRARTSPSIHSRCADSGRRSRRITRPRRRASRRSSSFIVHPRRNRWPQRRPRASPSDDQAGHGADSVVLRMRSEPERMVPSMTGAGAPGASVACPGQSRLRPRPSSSLKPSIAPFVTALAAPCCRPPPSASGTPFESSASIRSSRFTASANRR